MVSHLRSYLCDNSINLLKHNKKEEEEVICVKCIAL